MPGRLGDWGLVIGDWLEGLVTFLRFNPWVEGVQGVQKFGSQEAI